MTFAVEGTVVDTNGSFAHRSFRQVPVLAALALLSAITVRSEADSGVIVASPGPNGRLTGRVTVGPGLSSRRMRFRLYPDQVRPAGSTGGAHPAQDSGNVVVYLEEVSGASVPDGRDAPGPVMRQEGLAFQPHLLTILKGTTVEFPNGDPIFHNVFSLSRASSFDLGRYPQGASRSVRFEEPGVVKVFCHIHSDMNAIILVLDNPFFARPGADDRYRIDDIPPGEYRVIAWHERARPLRRIVRIEPGRNAVLDFSIPIVEPQDGD